MKYNAIIITGAAMRLGLATSELLASEGARLDEVVTFPLIILLLKSKRSCFSL